MQLIYHKTSWDVVPMLIIDDNVEYITQYLWHTSKSVGKLLCEFVTLRDYDICSLDPGGMYCTKIPHHQFALDGCKFDVQLSRIEEVLDCMERGKERIPGYIRFPNWNHFIIIPKKMFDKLGEQLKQLEMSDEALNAELLEKEIKDALYQKGFITRPKFKKFDE